MRRFSLHSSFSYPSRVSGSSVCDFSISAARSVFLFPFFFSPRQPKCTVLGNPRGCDPTNGVAEHTPPN